MGMNEDIKNFPVYALSGQGLIPIDIKSTEDYNHYTHNLHHFIKQQDWKRNQKWFKDHGIRQKLILMPIWVHNEIHGMNYSDKQFEEKFKISRWDLVFNKRYTSYD